MEKNAVKRDECTTKAALNGVHLNMRKNVRVKFSVQRGVFLACKKFFRPNLVESGDMCVTHSILAFLSMFIYKYEYPEAYLVYTNYSDRFEQFWIKFEVW